MIRTITLLSIKVVTALMITGCSTTPLQSTRLNKAETYIIQAEQAYTNSRTIIAKNNIGTAKAYLDTLKDNLKFLSKSEIKRYNTLRAREATTQSKLGLKIP